jgi:hypothetical protein
VKVQLGGKDYVSNLVSFGFEPQLPHFFLINYLCPMVWRWRTHVAVGRGGRPMWRLVRVVGPLGRGCGAGGTTWKTTWGDGPTWWSGT